MIVIWLVVDQELIFPHKYCISIQYFTIIKKRKKKMNKKKKKKKEKKKRKREKKKRNRKCSVA